MLGTGPVAAGARRRRLVAVMAAGVVDSLCLSVAWTVLMLQIVATYGFAVAGLCGGAMLVGVAASAPVAARLATLLTGRGVLHVAAACEAVLRVGVFVLVFGHGPVWMLVACIAAMHVTAWTGYAAMRAEVAAVSPGAAGITWYGTMVAAVEAGGIALAALLPLGIGGALDGPLVLVVVAYVLALLPTVVVAFGSPVPRAVAHRPQARPGARPARRPGMRSSLREAGWEAVRDAVRGVGSASPARTGAVLMFLGSAPTLLAVALAAELHGRAAVAPAAVAFVLGSLAAPSFAALVSRARLSVEGAWALCAAGMVAGWALAPGSVALLCLAQLLSGLCMTALEGLLDATAAEQNPEQVTGAIARATSGRALGAAAGTALLPLAVAVSDLRAVATVLTVVLLAGALVVLAREVRRAAGSFDAGLAGPSGPTGPVLVAVGPGTLGPKDYFMPISTRSSAMSVADPYCRVTSTRGPNAGSARSGGGASTVETT